MESNGKVVLVADDEIQVLDILKRVLERFGFSVLTAENGEIGLEILGREHVDIVVTDLGMPKMGGDLMLALARGQNIQIPFVAITGINENPTLTAKLKKDGFAAALHKPFDIDTVVSVIKQELEMEEAPAE